MQVPVMQNLKLLSRAIKFQRKNTKTSDMSNEIKSTRQRHTCCCSLPALRQIYSWWSLETVLGMTLPSQQLADQPGPGRESTRFFLHLRSQSDRLCWGTQSWHLRRRRQVYGSHCFLKQHINLSIVNLRQIISTMTTVADVDKHREKDTINLMRRANPKPGQPSDCK